MTDYRSLASAPASSGAPSGGLDALLHGLLLMIPYALIGLAAFVAAAWWLRVRESEDPGPRIMQRNAALGIRRAGMFVAIGIGLSGVYAGGAHSVIEDLRDSVIYAALLVCMIAGTLTINDRIVLPHVQNHAEVRDGNLAVATVEVGSMIATSFIARASIMGEGGGVMATLVFFALGQVALLLSVRCYAAFRRQCDIVRSAERGNVAAGIVLAAKFVAYGLVLSTAIAGPSEGWVVDAGQFAITAAAGIVFLLATDKLIDWLLVRWHTVPELVADDNAGSALVFAGGKVGMAAVISTLLV